MNQRGIRIPERPFQTASPGGTPKTLAQHEVLGTTPSQEICGYTRFPPLNAALAILGFLSLTIAAFNLLPIRPLDGSIAWGLHPALFERRPARPAKREPAWRSWRQKIARRIRALNPIDVR